MAIESSSNHIPPKIGNIVVDANINNQHIIESEFESNIKSAQDALNQNSTFKQGSVTIPNLQNFPLYSQDDKRYANEKIGIKDTMEKSGCTTTALSAVNAWKTFGQWEAGKEPHPGLYNDSIKYDPNGNLYWNSANISIPEKIDNLNFNDSAFETRVKDSVDKGHPVLFAVNGDAHWMVAIGYDKAGDVIVFNPGNGSVGTFEEINKKRVEHNKSPYKTISRFYEFN